MDNSEIVKRRENGASAKDGEGAGRGPCGLRNSELGPRPHDVLLAFFKKTWSIAPQKILPLHS